MGLDLKLVGLLFFVARSWDAVSDPIVGAMSDRTRMAYGRRRPWIVIGTPLLLLASYFVLIPPASMSNWTIGLSIFLFYTFWTAVYIPYQSWGAEVSTDYHERTRVAAFREGGSVIGVLVGIGIPLLLVDPVAEPLRQLLWPGGLGLTPSLGSTLTVIFLTVLVLLPITAYAACKLMPDPPTQHSVKISWRQSLGIFKRNLPLRRLVIAYFAAQLGFLIFLSSVQLIITQGLQIKAFLLLIFVQQLVAIACVPAWTRVAGRIGKHRAYCISLAFTIVGLLALNIIPSGNLPIAMLVFLFNGIGSSGKLIFPPALVADTVDYDTATTGTREAGTHVAIMNLANKATFAMSVGLAYPLFALVGFNASGANPPDVLFALMANQHPATRARVVSRYSGHVEFSTHASANDCTEKRPCSQRASGVSSTERLIPMMSNGEIKCPPF